MKHTFLLLPLLHLQPHLSFLTHLYSRISQLNHPHHSPSPLTPYPNTIENNISISPHSPRTPMSLPMLSLSPAPASSPTVLSSPQPTILICPPLLRKSEMISQKPTYLNDYVCNNIFFSDLTSSCFHHVSHPKVFSFGALSLDNQAIFKSISTVFQTY